VAVSTVSSRGKLFALAAIVGGLLFGAFGGEYRSIDYWKLKREVRRIEAEIAALELEVDSLAEYAELIEGDSATQERVARERFGMLRDGEVLYRVAGPGEGGGER
jgi:cell division protein FtsB